MPCKVQNLASLRRGQNNYQAGRAAEDTVSSRYQREGMRALATRWRGGGGELDLVFSNGDQLVFVEVKKSRTFARAAQSLRPAQINRILTAASVFVADQPAGQMTEMRFDVALVNQAGETEIIENAYLAA